MILKSRRHLDIVLPMSRIQNFLNADADSLSEETVLELQIGGGGWRVGGLELTV